MKVLLKTYKSKKLQFDFDKRDTKAQAESRMIINFLYITAAGISTQMREGIDFKEVVFYTNTRLWK